MPIQFQSTEIVELQVPVADVPIQLYLHQIDRIVGAIADPELTEKLTAEEFRLKMQPIGFLNFYEFQPIVILKVWCDRHHCLNLKSIDCQLKGLENFMDGFQLELDGTLKLVEQENKPQLQGCADLSVSLELPSALRFTPQKFLKIAGDHLLKEILQRIKIQLLKQLLRDYQQWAQTQREKPPLPDRP